MNAPLWVAAPVVALVVLAARADVRERRIPNALTGPAIVLALIAHFWFEGFAGLRGSLAGMLIAGGLVLPGFFFRFTGAGDVKLMAAVGAWFAFPHAVVAALFSFIAGGVVAVVVAARRGILRHTLWNTAWLAAWVMRPGAVAGSPPPVSGVRLPFALAVLAGAIVGLWIKV
jgi:prepilin peptidase CpaA